MISVKEMKKSILILLILMCFFIIFVPRYSYAIDTGLGDLNAYGGGDTDSVELQERAETILGVIQIIGVVVSVVMLIVIGIKYMLGSVEEKAEYKQTLKPYLIGAFLVFSGTTVPQLIYQIAKNI